MKGKRFWEIGGFIAGGILILFGAVAIYMGVDGRNTVRDSLKDEQVFFSTAADEDAATDKYASEWYGEQVTNGDQARAFAQIMREHQLERTEGLTYAQMGRYISAADPDDPAGTSDEEAALKDEEGNAISNPARQSWVTAVAITTATAGAEIRYTTNGSAPSALARATVALASSTLRPMAQTDVP